MSLEANIRVMAITRELQEQHIRGVLDICPANASYMVRYDPDVISPEDLLRHLEATDRSTTDLARVSLTSRVVDFPILFDDPWTREALMRARDRHQDPNSTDLEYAARINGFSSTEAFIEALCRAPYIVSMTGFVPGLPWCFQIAPGGQIEVPKYVRPRTYTPERAFDSGAPLWPSTRWKGREDINCSASPQVRFLTGTSACRIFGSPWSFPGRETFTGSGPST